MDDEEAVPQEEEGAHKQTNVNAIFTAQHKTKSMIEEIGSKINPGEDLLNNDVMDKYINPVLFIRGVPNDSFYLVLSGKVLICSGNEGFLLE